MLMPYDPADDAFPNQSRQQIYSSEFGIEENADERLFWGTWAGRDADFVQKVMNVPLSQEAFGGQHKALFDWATHFSPGQPLVFEVTHRNFYANSGIRLKNPIRVSLEGFMAILDKTVQGAFYFGRLLFPSALGSQPNMEGRWNKDSTIVDGKALYRVKEKFGKEGASAYGFSSMKFYFFPDKDQVGKKVSEKKKYERFIPEYRTPPNTIAGPIEKTKLLVDGQGQPEAPVVAELKPEGSLEGVYDWILPRLPSTSLLASEGQMSRSGVLLGYSRFPVINEDGTPKGFCTLFCSTTPIRIMGLPYYKGIITPQYARIPTKRGDLHVTGNVSGEALLTQVAIAHEYFASKGRFFTFCSSGDWEISGPSCGLALAVVCTGNFTNFLCSGELEIDRFGNASLLPVAGVEAKIKVAQHFKSPILMKGYAELRQALYENNINFVSSTELSRGPLLKLTGSVLLANDLGSALAATLYRDSQMGLLARQEAPRVKQTPAPAKKKAPLKPLQGVTADFVSHPPVEAALAAMTNDARSKLIQDLLNLEGQDQRMLRYMELGATIESKFKVGPTAFLRALRKGESEKMDNWLNNATKPPSKTKKVKRPAAPVQTVQI